MSLSLGAFFSVVISLLIALYIQKHLNSSQNQFSISVQSTFVIGILSAQENFAFREAARSTWLKNYLFNKNDSVKALFIIGNDSCKIPPEYRLNKYSCEKWHLNVSELQKHFTTAVAMQSKLAHERAFKIVNQGFSFKVNHPVLITKLGILFGLLEPNTTAKVAVLDIQSKVTIVQAVLYANDSNVINGFVYEKVEEILLPKNFEAMILVEGNLLHATDSTIAWENGGNVITFNQIYTSPAHMDTLKYSPDIVTAPSIEFMVEDIDDLKSIAQNEDSVTAQWISYTENLKQKIQVEAKESNDILLVDVVDTYRNLPAKLIQFYKWISLNYDFLYVMKTDDDAVIDVNALLQDLNDSFVFNPSKKWLWSRFRKDWPINYIGKWADYDYRATVYPSFPCGAAYVLSKQVALWLSSNSEHLFPYQGEDVSMGIWLAAIKPDFIENENFECDSKCSHSSYNRAQLSPQEIFDVWSIYEKYTNLCSSS